MRLFRYIVAGVMYTFAMEEVRRKNYLKAKNHTLNIYNILGARGHFERATPEVNMIYALISYYLQDFTSSKAAGEAAFEMLEKGSGRKSKAESRYLMYYCRTMIEASQWKIFGNNDVDIKYSDIKFSEIESDKVDIIVRKEFPITQSVLDDS